MEGHSPPEADPPCLISSASCLLASDYVTYFLDIPHDIPIIPSMSPFKETGYATLSSISADFRRSLMKIKANVIYVVLGFLLLLPAGKYLWFNRGEGGERLISIFVGGVGISIIYRLISGFVDRAVDKYKFHTPKPYFCIRSHFCSWPLE